MTLLPRFPRPALRVASAFVLLALAGGAASAQTVSISSAATGVDEGGSAVVTVTRAGSTANAVTVTVGFGAGSTAGAGEVSLAPTTLTIGAGQTTATTTLSAAEDADRDDETAVVEIKSADGATVGSPRSVTLAVRDNDVPRVTLEVADATVAEGGQTTITARLSQATTGAVSVSLGATGDADAFSINPLTISIPAGQTRGTATFRAAEDADTANETVVVSISGVSGGGAVEDGEQTRTVTITDNDGTATPLVTLSASPTTIAENGGTSTITIQLSRRASAATTVQLALGGDDDDVTLSATSVTIPESQTRATVTLTARSDNADFDDEAVTVEVTGVSGSNARESGDQQVTVTVTDDDPAPVTLSATPTFINEGQFSLLTVALPAGTRANAPVTVRLAYAVEDNDDDDTDGADRSDFRAPSQIVIAAGQNAATDTLFAVEDTIFEMNTDVTVSIDRVVGRAVEAGEQTATVTIASDDARPTVTFEASPNVIAARGGRSTLTATLSNATDEVVTVDLSYFGSASRGSNYTAPDALVVQPGQVTGSAPLVSTGGGGGKQVVINVVGVTNATAEGEQQEFVSFNEGLDRVQVSFADAAATVVEGAGAYAIRLALSEPLDAPATVTVTLASTTGGGAASDLGGFTSRSVTLPTGTRTATVSVPVTDDALREGVETFTFALSTTDTGRVQTGDGTFTLTVTDDDDRTTFVVNEVDGVVGRRSPQFVELFAAGGGGRADGLSLAVYGADSTVATVVDLDGLTADAAGYLVVCDTASDDPACDVEADGFPDVVAGARLFRGDGPDEGDDFDADDDDALDGALVDERAAARERAETDGRDVEAEDGSLQRQADGRFAFVVPPTPGAANRVGIPVSNEPDGPAAELVGDVFPNPSTGRASLDLSVAEAQRVRVTVYDVLGREVAVAYDGEARPGAAVRVTLGGVALAPGAYVVRVAGETFVESRRLTVTR